MMCGIFMFVLCREIAQLTERALTKIALCKSNFCRFFFLHIYYLLYFYISASINTPKSNKGLFFCEAKTLDIIRYLGKKYAKNIRYVTYKFFHRNINSSRSYNTFNSIE